MVTPPVKTRSRPQQAPKRAGVRPLIPPVPLFEKDLFLDSIKKSPPKPRMESSSTAAPDMDVDVDWNMAMDNMQLDGPQDLDPCLVSEYQEEIFAYKRMLEVKPTPATDVGDLGRMNVCWTHSLFFLYSFASSL